MPSESAALDPSLVKILIAYGDEMIASVLKQQLQPEGFLVTAVSGAAKALEALKVETYSIILADHEMAGVNGLELLAKVESSHPNMIRLLLTSTMGMKELVDAVKSELIHRFMVKPWIKDELLVVVGNSVACMLSTSAIHTPGQSANASAPASSEAGSTQEGSAEEMSPEMADVAIKTYIKMLGTFHPNLGNTATRAMALCETIAGLLELPIEQARSLAWAGALHDIGLVGTDRSIVRRWLRSPEKCTEEELSLLKRHPLEAQQMLLDTPVFKEAADIIRGHHESWDGTGYPDRLKGESIPWLSRVLAAAVYFASRHQPSTQVLNEIQSLSEKLFDPQAIEVLGRAIPLTTMPRGEREILLIELQAGMILAKDIYNTSGLLILAKDRELTTAWINKIMSINNATPLNPYVMIYC